MGERGGRNANRTMEALGQIPALMQAIENARAKGIARACRSGYELLRQFDRRLPDIFPFSCPYEPAFGKMDYYQFADSRLKQSAGRVPQRDGVQGAIRLADFKTGGFAGLDFVKDAIVDELESGRDDPLEAVAVFADHVNAGSDAGLLGCGQQPSAFGPKLRVSLVERVQQQQVPEMKDRRLDLAEIEVLAFPKSVGPAVMEKCATSIALFGHDIGIGSMGIRSFAEEARVDLML